LALQRKQALLSEYQSGGVVQPTGLPPGVTRETIAPVHTLIHPYAVAPPRDPREGRPVNLLGTGKRPVR
jgi:hypothetical protein